MKVEIEVNDGEVIEQVVAGVVDRMDAKFSDVLEERLSGIIETRLTKLTDERLSAEMEKVLANGWQLTDGYGRPTGEKLTLAAKVLAYITKGGYHDPMDTIFRNHIEKAMQGEMGKLIKEATDKLRAALDESIAAKLREAVTKALK